MDEETQRAQIDSAKIRVGGGIAGAIFTLGSLLIFLIGIPVLRYLFPAAILLGCAVAMILHFLHHDRPYTPWLLPGTEKVKFSKREKDGSSRRSAGIFLKVLRPADLSR